MFGLININRGSQNLLCVTSARGTTKAGLYDVLNVYGSDIVSHA